VAREPLPAVLESLRASRREGRPFAQAWPIALAAGLDALPDPDFAEWARALLRTWRAWADAYEQRPSRLRSLGPRCG
jgi:hypothetical protein